LASTPVKDQAKHAANENLVMKRSDFVTPKAFTHGFMQAAIENGHQLAELWFEFRPYTRLMLEMVLPSVAKRLNLESWPTEYYYLDSVFYKEKDTKHFRKDVMNVQFIEVAIEHEHVLSGTAQEVSKLQLINSPLKVLITYDANDTQRQKYLAKYCEIVASADIFKDASKLRRQLVIFGRKGTRSEIIWDAYQYENSQFIYVN
jgi:hypothetical protein